jgi:hypothetical protein
MMKLFEPQEEIGLSTIVKPKPGLVFREESDDCAILFDPDSGSVRILNETAAAVWKKLDGKIPLSEAFADLRQEFEEFGPEAEAQIRDLILELVRLGSASLETRNA